jgi:hypothetical protein
MSMMIVWALMLRILRSSPTAMISLMFRFGTNIDLRLLGSRLTF